MRPWTSYLFICSQYQFPKVKSENTSVYLIGFLYALSEMNPHRLLRILPGTCQHLSMPSINISYSFDKLLFNLLMIFIIIAILFLTN
jgi:hypothetical protein